MKINYKKMSREVGHHVLILFKGFFKMLYGAAMAGMIAAGVHGFVVVSTEGGYAAVCDFLVSICLIGLALVGTYLMGGHGKKGAKK